MGAALGLDDHHVGDVEHDEGFPHGGAADVAHLGTELLLVQKFVGAVLTVQNLRFQVLVSLQLQAEL